MLQAVAETQNSFLQTNWSSQEAHKNCLLACCAAGLADRAAAARKRLLQHQQAQALSQAPSLSGLLAGSQQMQQPSQQLHYSTGGFGSSRAAGASRVHSGVLDGSDEQQQRLPLAVRLKLPADGAAEGSLLPVQLLRKYIAYAREHVHPVLSDEAKEILQVRGSIVSMTYCCLTQCLVSAGAQ